MNSDLERVLLASDRAPGVIDAHELIEAVAEPVVIAEPVRDDGHVADITLAAANQAACRSFRLPYELSVRRRRRGARGQQQGAERPPTGHRREL